MDFQYGRLPFSRLTSPSPSAVYNQLFSFGDLSSTTATATSAPSPCFDADGASSSGTLMGFSYPVRQGDHQSGGFNWGIQDNVPMNIHSNLASSIESLSSINQDLHWKLQQQRLAMLYVEENQHKENSTSVSSGHGGGVENQLAQGPQHLSFQNLEISKHEACAPGNQLMRSGVVGTNNTANTTEWLFENSYTPATTSTSSNGNGNNSGMNNWNGVQVWSDMQMESIQ
ncbi:hypothetical protein IFM89_035698 [Coptis chinensis]|uniref:Uncharacterized protein n=1 Tax=Coptis chinensis TaxID=261450 RepID=A0A835ITT8_9MAGN|nr:hypothetical protein IFM89_035698 [Coptis chinensis]